MANVPNTNTGHGHVWSRPDGLVGRCGGPGLCAECLADLIRFRQNLQPAAKVLKLIHSNPIVRFVWDYLRLKRAAGHDDPTADPLTKAGIAELKKKGVPIPDGDDWWREPHWPKLKKEN